MHVRRLVLPALWAALSGCATTVTNEPASYTFTDDSHGNMTVLDSRLSRLEKLAQEYPKRSDIPYQIAGVHYQKADLKASAKSLERAIYIDPSEAKYHYHLGRVYLRMRELDRAETAFRRALDLMPAGRYTGGHAALGYVLCQKGRWDEARAEFEVCQRVDPKDPTPYFFLGCVDDARKDSKGAVANLKEYLRRGGKSYQTKAAAILASYGEAPPPRDPNAEAAEESDVLLGDDNSP